MSFLKLKCKNARQTQRSSRCKCYRYSHRLYTMLLSVDYNCLAGWLVFGKKTAVATSATDAGPSWFIPKILCAFPFGL